MAYSQVGQSQIEGILEALMGASADRVDETRESIFKAVVVIGRKKHVLVLRICHSYLNKHNRLPNSHRIILLKLLEKISKEHIHEISEDLAKDLVVLASAELTRSQDVVPEWQTVASSLLSTLGIQHAKLVLQELLTKFQPGTTPHFFVVQTLGQLAISNVTEVVPLLKTVLGRMLPMLGIKQENMQWVFSNTIARFCEAILDFLADEQRAAEAHIRAEDFEGEVYAAYEQLFNVWLQSKEAKLRLAVAEALGFIVHLCSAEQLNEQLPKLIPGISQLYKKHTEHYYISQCLYNVLDAAQKKKCENFGVMLDSLLIMLYQHACIPVSASNPVTIKSHNEILRCFEVATKAYSDRVVGFLLTRLEVNQEKTRVPTLEVLKHLINSCDTELDDKKSLIVSGMKIILSEQSLKVRRIFGQVMIAMAHHNYLSLEGGELMVEFIVRQCSIDPDDKALAKISTDGVTPKGLKDMSDSVLLLVTTTIGHMESVLWPYLIEFLVPVDYTLSVGIVARCVATIGDKKRKEEAEDYELNYEEMVNLPKAPALTARLIVLAGHPQNGQGRGEHVLNCMKALAPNLHEDLVGLWDAALPKLLSYLNEQNEKGVWDQKHWEDRVLKLLSLTLENVENEEWLMELGNAMGDKDTVVSRYSNFPEEKGFLYKCLGVIMRKSTHKEFVQTHLDTIFSTIKHANQVEREGCAIGTGFCAATHLDTVVQKLEQVTKDDMVRKSRGFFGFSKDKSEADVERIKATVMLCYGYVTFHSPPKLITSRVEVNILRSINPHFAKIKDPVVKQNLIRTIDLIGKALHPDHLKSTEFVFSKRGDLINHLLGYIRAEPVNGPIATETRLLAISALGTLAKLDPKLSPADQFDLTKVSLDSVFPLPLMLYASKKKETVSVEESQEMMTQALKEVDSLLIVLLSKEFSSDNLESIFKHMEPWIQSSNEVERTRAMSCLVDLLKAYFAHSEENEPSRHLPLQGHLLGRMVPRCSDPSLTIRQTAIDCIQIILKIATCMPGITDQLVDALSLLRERAESDEPNSLYSLVNDLSKVLCKKVSSEHLWSLVTFLLDGLVDLQGHSSSGACVVLNSIVKLRGTSLSEQIPDLIDGLEDKLHGITSPQTRTGTLRCMRTICHQYLAQALTHLLNKPLPWDENLVSMWQVLAGDVQLIGQVFSHLLEVLSLSLPYQEKNKGSKTIRIETDVPKAATNAIGVLCQVQEVAEVIKEFFSRILSALLLRIGVSSSMEQPEPRGKKPSSISVAVEALRQFLACSESTMMLDRLEQDNVWALLEKEDTCPVGMLYTARALMEQRREEVHKTVDYLSSFLTSIYDPQRITVVSFYSELVCLLGEEEISLAEQIMNNLLGRQVDNNYVVRMYCIRGLGNMADIGGSQVSKFSTTILSAMLAGMDDREDPEDLITMEAMSGLSRIFEQIDEGHVRPILINIALRIRPCFEKPTPAVRAAAFTLFGTLSRFGSGPSEGPFLEQIQTNFVSLLLHLNEADPVVVAACKAALRKLSPLIKSAKVNKMFQQHLDPEESLLYGEFLNDLCKLIVQDFTDKVNFYVMNAVTFFKSMWPEVKSNAALFVGYMLGNLPAEKSGVISKEHVCGALLLLLKDPSPQVRASTAEAMSLLDEY